MLWAERVGRLIEFVLFIATLDDYGRARVGELLGVCSRRWVVTTAHCPLVIGA